MAIKDVLSEILCAEKQAEEHINDARRKAQASRQELDKECAEQIAAAKQEAQKTIARSSESARKEAEQSRQKQISDALQKEKAAIDSMSGKIEEMADTAAEIIITTETGQGN